MAVIDKNASKLLLILLFDKCQEVNNRTNFSDPLSWNASNGHVAICRFTKPSIKTFEEILLSNCTNDNQLFPSEELNTNQGIHSLKQHFCLACPTAERIKTHRSRHSMLQVAGVAPVDFPFSKNQRKFYLN